MSQSYLNVVSEVEKTAALWESLENLAGQHPNLPAVSVVNSIKQKSQDNRLQIMFYGAYNAGKSTLINTILAAEQAKTADIPTTDSVDSYGWNGITLLDTPGVNAPIAHQNVTDAQLKRTAVIVFVIRSGDMDAKDVYERLLDLLQREKKIFIVLNHELTDAEERKKAADYVRGILLRYGGEKQIATEKLAEVSIFPINLRTALKGRLSDQEKLTAHSGFTAFLQAFEQWTTRQNNEREKFDHFKNYVDEQWYQPVLAVLNSLREESDQQALMRLEDQKSALNVQKNVLLNQVFGVIRQQIGYKRSEIRTILQDNTDEYAVKSELNAIFSDINETIKGVLRSKLQDVELYFQKNYALPVVQNEEAANAVLDMAVSIGKEFLQDGKTVETTVKQGLMMARDLKIPFLKGRWESTLGNWAGKANWIIQAGLALWEVHSAAKAEEEQNAKRREAAMRLEQTTNQICDDFEAYAIRTVENEVANGFAEELELIQSQISEKKAQNKALSECYATFSESQKRVYDIRYQ